MLHSSHLHLRPEQQSAIDQTYKYWQESQDANQRKFLWNAKPRFGKTITAYHFAAKIQAKRILIITNRPAISDSWQQDFFQYFAKTSDYIFATPKGDQRQSKTHRPTENHVYSRNELLNDFQLLQRPLIFFISLPDLKGKDLLSQSFKKKNSWIFDQQFRWDLLIIDEGHDGIKTIKTSHVLSELNVNFTLYLSGTPFRAIADKDFDSSQIFNWSYVDEQRAHNSDMPKIHFLAIPLEKTFENNSQSQLPSSLHELFSVHNDKFVNPRSVNSWLDALVSLIHRTTNQGLPLNHSLWLMSSVAECEAMQKELQKHHFFKDYEVILAAGKTSRDQKNLKRVRAAIGEEPNLSKTITLSCGQLTTGITVPEWSLVLMLYSSIDLERVSSAQYLQAVFRAQNSCNMENYQKTKCLVMDFSPDRIFTILREYAVNLCTKEQADAKSAMQELLGFLKVKLLVDEHHFKNLSALDIIELPRQTIAKEIVDTKFMGSSRLFNAKSFLNMSDHARRIICKFNSTHKGRVEKTPRLLPPLTIDVDENGQALPDVEFIQQAFQETIHNPKYATIARLGKQKINNLALLQAAKTPQNSISNELKNYPKNNQEEIRAFLREVNNCATQNARKHRKRAENNYHDKLRGFTRTIPALLHAYGRSDLTFTDLTEITPDRGFENITGITKNEFKILINEGYFEQVNCTLALQEFMRREDDLSGYFLSNSQQNIFDFIPSHQNNHVFTPRSTVKLMIERIKQQNPMIFHSSRTRFFDPSSKSGLFLAEVVKELLQNIHHEFASEHDCLIHILTHQVYAWSPSSFLRQSTINTLLRFLRIHPNLFSNDEIEMCENHFLEFNPIKEKGGFNRHEIRQTIKAQWGNDMKFDVILGNPPYQYGRRQVYADFYRLAVELDPEIICMVFPTGWQKTNNHNGLGLLNKPKYKRDPHLVLIDNYKGSSANKLFPELGTGGVNIVLRDKSHDNHGQIQKFEAGQEAGAMILPINDSEIIKPPELTCLIEPLKLLPKVESLGSARKPYGFYADPLRHPEKYGLELSLKPQSPDDVRLFGLLADSTRGYRFVSRGQLPKISANIDSYKLFVPKAWGNMSERIGLGGSYANICVANPGDACSETFIEFGPFKNQDEAIKMAKYFMTKFFRALLFLAKDSQNTAKDKYKYIPLPNLQDDIWQNSVDELDELLFDKYHVSLTSQTFIRDNIQPRNETNIEIL